MLFVIILVNTNIITNRIPMNTDIITNIISLSQLDTVY
jgi:hypothetical protein